MGPGEMFVLIAITVAMVKIFTGPIGFAIGERCRGAPRETREGELAAEVERLQARLSEVEERLDFAERLLARGEADQIHGSAMR